jgi:hypothetical protein
VCFGRLPNPSSAEEIPFDFFGYPNWGFVASEQETKATGLHIKGNIYVADISANGLVVLEVKRTPSILEIEKAILEDKSPWQGTSGAAIICKGFVVGVQRWTPNPDRPESLEAESLAGVFGNKDWCLLLQEHDINPDPQPVISIVTNSRSYRTKLLLYPPILWNVQR